MVRPELSDDLVRDEVQRGKQRAGAVALVVLSARGRLAVALWWPRSRLYLVFLVGAQRQGMIR